MTTTQIAGIGLVVLAVGVGIGRYTTPTKVETKVEEKIVEKIITKEAKTNNKNREYVVIEVISPDGTIRREKRLIDKGVITVEKEASTERVIEKTVEKIVERKSDTYGVSLLYGKAIRHFSEVPAYGLVIDKKFIGPVKLGVFGFTNGLVGLSVGVSF